MEPGTSELTAVMNRLEKLEKQNRRFKQIGALAMILLGSVFLMGQASPPRTVEANEFILKDSNGNVRGRWSVRPESDGEPSLVLYDPNGFERIALGLGLGGAWPSLVLYLRDGRLAAELTEDNFTFRDGDGRVRGRLGMLTTGIAGLELDDEQGRKRASLIHAGPLGPILYLNSALKQDPLAEENFVRLTEDRITLGDIAGFQTIIGVADLVTPRTGETHKTSAASVVMFDKDKKVLWKAP